MQHSISAVAVALAVAIALPMTARADGQNPLAAHDAKAHRRCPYDFASEMPAATFCVYEGIALNRDGEVCATSVVVIWSSMRSHAGRQVHVGFVADPDLVVQGVTGSAGGDGADMVAYSIGSARTHPVTGHISLRTADEHADVFRMDVRDGQHFDQGDCVLASYSGTFVGLIGPTAQAVVTADRLQP